MMCTHAGVVSQAECPWCWKDRAEKAEGKLAEARREVAERITERDALRKDKARLAQLLESGGIDGLEILRKEALAALAAGSEGKNG